MGAFLRELIRVRNAGQRASAADAKVFAVQVRPNLCAIYFSLPTSIVDVKPFVPECFQVAVALEWV